MRPPTISPVYNTDRVGQFSIDLSPASPQNETMIDYENIDPVAFLLRIEVINSQTFSFMWAVSYTLTAAKQPTISVCMTSVIMKSNVHDYYFDNAYM